MAKINRGNKNHLFGLWLSIRIYVALCCTCMCVHVHVCACVCVVCALSELWIYYRMEGEMSVSIFPIALLTEMWTIHKMYHVFCIVYSVTTMHARSPSNSNSNSNSLPV